MPRLGTAAKAALVRLIVPVSLITLVKLTPFVILANPIPLTAIVIRGGVASSGQVVGSSHGLVLRRLALCGWAHVLLLLCRFDILEET